MEFFTAYLAGVVAVFGMWAWRVPHEDVRMVFLLAMAWPLTIVAVLFTFAVTAFGWDFDAAQGTKLFGFRRPTNTEVVGFALTLFRVEFQMWRARKA